MEAGGLAVRGLTGVASGSEANVWDPLSIPQWRNLRLLASGEQPVRAPAQGAADHEVPQHDESLRCDGRRLSRSVRSDFDAYAYVVSGTGRIPTWMRNDAMFQ